jgi:peptidoglycan/xylan/chitin deacetylase (PgdA/CDA1 family)
MSLRTRYAVADRARIGLATVLGAVATWRGVVSLAYHRIGTAEGSPFDHGLWSASEEGFDAQVRFLVRHFDLIAPDDLAEVCGRRRRRGRYVIITFDDGYRDNHDRAFPILKRHGAVATFFLSTGFLDRPRLPFWDEIAWMVRTCPLDGLPAGPWGPAPLRFDAPHRERAVRAALRAYKAQPAGRGESYLDAMGAATGRGRYRGPADDVWMTWDMARALRRAGMTIGGHTANHPILARLTRAAQEAEVAECRRRISDEVGAPMTCFSYPNGGPADFNADTRACLAAHGVSWAFSYYGGMWGAADPDPYDIPRTGVESWHSSARIRALLSAPRLLA